MKICRVSGCGIELNETNCCPSFLKRGFTICRKCNNNERKMRNVKRRNNILIKLGGKCGCCGIDNLDLLSIDHINGNGAEDRHSFNSWKHYLNKLLNMPQNELLKDYRCLCYNCNYTRGFWGVCAHQFENLTEEQIALKLKDIPVSNRGVKNIHLSDANHDARGLILKQLRRVKYKLEMIKAYGGKCECCNETSALFLTLDHINNNGYLEKGGTDLYQRLKTLGYPGKNTQLQLLCHNCNAQKEYIQNRVNRTENIKTTSDIYIKQDYSLTEEQDNALWEKARLLYAKIKCIAGDWKKATKRKSKTIEATINE